MASQLQIDQTGLPAGLPGISRTDGLDTGATVTLTNTGSGSTTTFRLLDVPLGDTTAEASLAPTGSPEIWEFDPTAGTHGTYLIELIEDENQPTERRERRIFGVRLPSTGLLIPALNEIADPNASLILDGPAQIEASDNNAQDYTSDTDLNGRRYAGWWRAVYELFQEMEAIGGGGSATGPNGAVQYSDGAGNFLGTANATLDAAGNFSSGASGSFGGNLTVGGKLTVGGLIDPTGLVLTEQNVNPWIPVAGEAAVWVRDDSPNILMFTDDLGVDHTVDLDGAGGGTPGGANRNVQFNDGGSFGGEDLWNYFASGDDRRSRLTAASGTGVAAYELVENGGPIVGAWQFDENTNTLTLNSQNAYALTISAAGALTMQAVNSALNINTVGGGPGNINIGSGALLALSGTSLTLNGGVDTLTWPANDGGAGEFLTTDGAGNLSWGTPSGSPSQGAADTLNTADGAGAWQATNIQATGTSILSATGLSLNAQGGQLFMEGNTSTLLQTPSFQVEVSANPTLVIDGTTEASVAADTVLTWNGTQNEYLARAGIDTTAIHEDVAGEIAGVTLKGTPTASDLLLIEDAADSNNKKRITIGSLPTAGGGYTTVQDEGSPLTQRSTIDFVGAGVTATDDGSKTVVTIPGGGGSTLGFDFIIADKQDFVDAATSVGGGIITLPSGSYCIVGNIDLTQVIGGGTTSSDKLRVGQFTRFINLTLQQYTINGTNNSPNPLIEVQTNSSIFVGHGLALDNNGSGSCVRCNGTNSQLFLRDDSFECNADSIEMNGAGSSLICEFSSFSAGTDAISVLANMDNLTVRNAAYTGGQRMIDIDAGQTVTRLRVTNNRCTAQLGTSGIEIDGTVTNIEVSDNLIWAGGTCITAPGTITGGRIVNNTLIAGSQFSAFNGISPSNQTGAGTSATFLLLRDNLWRNSAGNSWFHLRESVINSTHNPPA
jgi:hypothetical protein